ncbi:MAG: type II toxin-antitoxin system RelE/ParE family toxin [Methylocystis sp.]
MRYLVELTERAARDLGRLHRRIDAENSRRARDWFNELEALVFSLDQSPGRGAACPEDRALRQLRFGKRRDVYRLLYSIDEERQIVTVLHIRHSASAALRPQTDGETPP